MTIRRIRRSAVIFYVGSARGRTASFCTLSLGILIAQDTEPREIRIVMEMAECDV